MFGIRREQGRLAELAPVVRVLAAGDARAARGGRAWSRCSPSSGMDDEARARARRRARRRPRSVPRRRSGLASLTYLADAATPSATSTIADDRSTPSSSRSPGERDDRPRRRVLRVGAIATSGCSPPTARRLRSGRAALRGGARRSNRRMGATTWLAHTAYEYGAHARPRG